MVQAVLFLGNPGVRYRDTRHNAGRLLFDTLLQIHPGLTSSPPKNRFKGLYTAGSLPGRPPVHLLLPETYMNRSGESAAALAGFFKIPPENLLAVHDDLELPFGKSALKTGGGLGGHNGLRSLKQSLGTSGFQRLRFGIGRPRRGDVSSWVLGRWIREEQSQLPERLDRAGRLLLEHLEEGPVPPGGGQ